MARKLIRNPIVPISSSNGAMALKGELLIDETNKSIYVKNSITGSIDELGKDEGTADNISFSNDDTRLSSTNVQDAIVEVTELVDNVTGTIPDFIIRKEIVADSGYTATYRLYKDSNAVGDKINIPKDYLVKSASVEQVTADNDPMEGYVIGQKYIDFIVNTSDNSGNISHIYILVDDMMERSTAININVLSTNWIFNSTTGLYENIISFPGLRSNEQLDVGMYNDGTATDEQILAYSSISDILTSANQITITSEELPTVSFTIVLTGKVDIDDSIILNLGDVIDQFNDAAEMIDSLNGTILTILSTAWVSDAASGKFKNVIDVTGIKENDVLSVAIYDDGTTTDAQKLAFDELVEEISIEDDLVTLYATIKPTVSFPIILHGKMNINNSISTGNLNDVIAKYDEMNEMMETVNETINSINRKLNTITYTFIKDPAYPNDASIRISQVNGILYVRAQITVIPIPAWQSVKIGSIQNWNYGEIGYLCSVSSCLGASSISAYLTIDAQGNVLVVTHAAITGNAQWYYGISAYNLLSQL